MGFYEGFIVLGARVAVGDDSGADGEVDAIVVGDHGADGDVELDVAVDGKVADRAAVRAAAGGLELFDDLR